LSGLMMYMGGTNLKVGILQQESKKFVPKSR